MSSEQDFPTVEDFMRKYRMDCPAALVRIKEDRPITVKDDKGNTQKMIADTVALFITSHHKLQLNNLHHKQMCRLMLTTVENVISVG